MTPRTALFRRFFLKFLNLSLRTKFILSFLVVIITGGLVSLFFGTRLEHRTIFSLAEVKVRHDLASAWTVYQERINDIRDILQLNSIRDSIQQAILHRDRETLYRLLNRIRLEFGLNILSVTDENGRVILRTRNPENFGDNLSNDPLIRRAIKGETVSGTGIMPREIL